MNGIFDGFEGFRTPQEDQILQALRKSPVILDTNVLLDLYRLDEPPRKRAIEILRGVGARLWVPHQVMTEFWRNRNDTLLQIDNRADHISDAQINIRALFNSLSVEEELSDKLKETKNAIDARLEEIKSALQAVRGEQIDVKRALLDMSKDPIIVDLQDLLKDNIGKPYSKEILGQKVNEGLERFEKKIPPGHVDGQKKKDQIPERGTGDYLMWEQTLQHLEGLEDITSFIIVSGEKKSDWRSKIPKVDHSPVRPELVEEALNRTGAIFYLLHTEEFYRLASSAGERPDSITSALLRASSFRPEEDASLWDETAFEKLIDRLSENGYIAQHDAILTAAENDGFITRSQVYEVAGYDPDRSLKRFAVPASRITEDLISEGILPEGCENPLRAAYPKSSRQVSGYDVPEEFCEFHSRLLDDAWSEESWDTFLANADSEDLEDPR